MEPHSGNKVFEILEDEDLGLQLWFKGKLLNTKYPGIADEYGFQFDVLGPCVEIFDFEARELPIELYLIVEQPNKECRALLLDTSVYWEKDEFLLKFCFWVSDEAMMHGDVNVEKMFVGIWDKAKENGYKVGGDVECRIIEVAVPPDENVYLHYRKHLEIFETYCNELEAEMVQRLMEKTQSTFHISDN